MIETGLWSPEEAAAIDGSYSAKVQLSMLPKSYQLRRDWGMGWSEVELLGQTQNFNSLLGVLGYLSLNAVSTTARSGMAVREPGASNAVPGYESILDDYLPYNTGNIVRHDTGYGQAPMEGAANSIYTQTNQGTGEIRSMTVYDEQGRRVIRLDVFGDHPHGNLGINHVHIQTFNERGQVAGGGDFTLTQEKLFEMITNIGGGK